MKPARGPLDLVARFFGSYGLACVLMFFLMVAVYFGTWAQVEHGLYAAQKKYFESWFYRHDLGPVPAVFPGVVLLLSLLSLNLIIGGMIRMRWDWRRSGVLIAHFGIAFLMFAAFWKFQYSTEGHLRIYESGDERIYPRKSDDYASATEWEVAVREYAGLEGGPTLEYLVDSDDFLGLSGSRAHRFSSPDLPFELILEDFERNCDVRPGESRTPWTGTGCSPFPGNKTRSSTYRACEPRCATVRGAVKRGCCGDSPGHRG